MNTLSRTAWAAAKYNGDFVCLETCSGYRSFTVDPSGKQYLLSPDVNDKDLGSAVLDCLAHSRFIPPRMMPEEDLALFDRIACDTRYSEWVNSMMAIYGYKTRRSLFKNMTNCSIQSRGGIITIDPSHHEKLEAWSGEGISKEDSVSIPENLQPSEIGEALRLAFSRCT